MDRLSRIIGALGRMLGGLGAGLETIVNRVLGICALFYRLLLGAFSGPACLRLFTRELTRQIYFTAIKGVYILVFSALILGMLVIVHATQQLVKIQGEEFVGWLLVTIVVREVGPLWAALFVLLHSGGAITVEIGTMSVDREVQALHMMGIDPYRYLGVPRFWGLIISLVSLYILCAFAAILGGYIFAQAFAEIFWAKFLLSFINALQWVDLSVAFAKTTIFGMLIATVSIYFGFNARNYMGEVAQNTSRAALYSLVFLGIVDIIITTAYYI
jgi:phospholipid/cholesterol/gamma-HCH transport system permease protein